jgi:hypothetical protein
MPYPYLSSHIHCASCCADLEIIFSAPGPGSQTDYFAAVGIAATPIAPDTTTCPHCGGYIGDHSGDGDDPRGRRATAIASPWL